jgi:hypothetical protein
MLVRGRILEREGTFSRGGVHLCEVRHQAKESRHTCEEGARPKASLHQGKAKA